MISNLQLNDIFIDKSKGFVYIVLCRTEALNALTLDMTRVISIAVQKAAADMTIKGIFISGDGDKAFCAGGDLKSLYSGGMAYRRGETKENLARIFFEEEYNLNSQIKTFPKLYISFLNGITMGGGYGISAHGSHVVATEKTSFAMPEVKIGFFPDVGASYNLSRCPHNIGLYLSLTGSTVSATDMHFAGLCEAIVDSAQIDRIKARIVEMIEADNISDFEEQKKAVSEMLAKRHLKDLPPSSIEANVERIEDCFGHDSVENIMAAVSADTSDWGQETYAALKYACPFSQKVAHEQYKRAADLEFGQVIAQDYILATHFIESHELYEGIRATVIDKSKNPRWQPSNVSDVLEKDVLNYFLPINLL